MSRVVINLSTTHEENKNWNTIVMQTTLADEGQESEKLESDVMAQKGVIVITEKAAALDRIRMRLLDRIILISNY